MCNKPGCSNGFGRVNLTMNVESIDPPILAIDLASSVPDDVAAGMLRTAADLLESGKLTRARPPLPGLTDLMGMADSIIADAQRRRSAGNN